MTPEFRTDAVNDLNQKKVINNLEFLDILLIVLPMITAVISAVIVAVNSAGGGWIGELIGPACIMLSIFFCALYGVLALILSRITTGNTDFRLSLIGALTGVAMLFTPSIAYSGLVMLAGTLSPV